jgi:hypothetical protein
VNQVSYFEKKEHKLPSACLVAHTCISKVTDIKLLDLGHGGHSSWQTLYIELVAPTEAQCPQ